MNKSEKNKKTIKMFEKKTINGFEKIKK